MRQAAVQVSFLCAKINHKQRHAVLHIFVMAVTVFPAVFFRNHPAVCIGYISVGYYDIRQMDITVSQLDSFYFAVITHQDLPDRGVDMYLAALFNKQFMKRIHNCTGSAYCIMDAPLSFQVMDHGIDAGGIKRIAANQQRMKGKYLPQKIISDVLRDILVYIFIGLQPYQVRSNPDHIADFQASFFFPETYARWICVW